MSWNPELTAALERRQRANNPWSEPVDPEFLNPPAADPLAQIHAEMASNSHDAYIDNLVKPVVEVLVGTPGGRRFEPLGAQANTRTRRRLFAIDQTCGQSIRGGHGRKSSVLGRLFPIA